MSKPVDNFKYSLACSNGHDFVFVTGIGRLTDNAILQTARNIACESYHGAIALDWNGLIPEIRYAADGEFQAMTAYVVPTLETI